MHPRVSWPVGNKEQPAEVALMFCSRPQLDEYIASCYPTAEVSNLSFIGLPEWKSGRRKCVWHIAYLAGGAVIEQPLVRINLAARFVEQLGQLERGSIPYDDESFKGKMIKNFLDKHYYTRCAAYKEYVRRNIDKAFLLAHPNEPPY